MDALRGNLFPGTPSLEVDYPSVFREHTALRLMATEMVSDTAPPNSIDFHTRRHFQKVQSTSWSNSVFPNGERLLLERKTDICTP